MLTEQERDRFLLLLEREVNSGNLLSLYRDGTERLTLEVRHGSVIELHPVLPQRMTREEAEQELADLVSELAEAFAAADLEMLGGSDD